MARCLIALGSNLGDRSETLRKALREIARLAHVCLLARSQWHETVPIGGPLGQEPYLNGAVLLETRLPASELLRRLLEIESRLGRQRWRSPQRDGLNDGDGLSDGAGLSEGRWSPRTVDLDLLLYGVECCESTLLRLPHPRMTFRRFVLEPAVEIAGWMPHPTSGSVLARLLWQLNTAGDYVAIVATSMHISAMHAAQWLTRELALTLGCCWRKHEGPLGPCQVPEETAVYYLQPYGYLQPCGGGQPSDTGGKKQDMQSLFCPGSVNMGGGESGADSRGNRESLPAYPKLVIAWEKRAVKDRMEEMERAFQGEDRLHGKPDETTFPHGPKASILTTNAQQALAEALAAIQSIWPGGAIWPAGYDMARGIPQT
jgi:2-amino-4-hydroxy-6-hydroxymethyldihydropteridine diphosphokinase